MRPPRSGVALLFVLLTSTSCAAQTESTRTPNELRPSPSNAAGCERTGSGFAVDLAVDKGGQSTPLAAVVQFGGHGGIDGYQAPADEWVWAPNPTDSEGQDVGGATLHTDRVFLVTQLKDHSWAVDSGGHCAAVD